MIGDSAYFVSIFGKLVRLNLTAIDEAIRNNDGREIGDDQRNLLEVEVCEDVRYIFASGDSLTILRQDGSVSNLENLQARLDLNEACGEPDNWTAIGRRGNKAVAAGYYRDLKVTRFVLIDLASMTVTDQLDLPGVGESH